MATESTDIHASLDKLFRQSDLLKRASEGLQQNGGEPHLTRVKHGFSNLDKTLSQVREETTDADILASAMSRYTEGATAANSALRKVGEQELPVQA